MTRRICCWGSNLADPGSQLGRPLQNCSVYEHLRWLPQSRIYTASKTGALRGQPDYVTVRHG